MRHDRRARILTSNILDGQMFTSNILKGRGLTSVPRPVRNETARRLFDDGDCVAPGEESASQTDLRPDATRRYVEQPDPDASGEHDSATETEPAPGSSAKRIGRRGCLPWLLVALALLAAGLYLADRDDGGSDEADVTEPAAVPAASEPPIVLPGPVGTAPRVRPLQTVVIIDDEVPALFEGDDLTDEIRAAAEYLLEHQMVGDGLGLGPSNIDRLSTSAISIRAEAESPPIASGPPGEVVTPRGTMLADYPDDDHAIIVITTSPSGWTSLMPVAAPPDASVPPEERPPIERGFVISVGEGTSPGGLPEGLLGSPNHLGADPSNRGELAEAIARSWVAGFGGGWPT